MSCDLCGQKSMNCDCTPLERELHERCEAMEGQLHDLQDALEKSVKLQSHYAEQLNMYDGGERMQFASATDWIQRLNETKGD